MRKKHSETDSSNIKIVTNTSSAKKLNLVDINGVKEGKAFKRVAAVKKSLR